MTATTQFRPYPVKVHAVRKFHCERCDRPAQRKRTFCRRVKQLDTQPAVLAAVEQLAETWQPTMHRWCESRPRRLPLQRPNASPRKVAG